MPSVRDIGVSTLESSRRARRARRARRGLLRGLAFVGLAGLAASCTQAALVDEGADAGDTPPGFIDPNALPVGGFSPGAPGGTGGAGAAPSPGPGAPVDDLPPQRVDPPAPEAVETPDAGAPPLVLPDAGASPESPPPVDPGPEAPPPQNDGPCGGIDFIGECEGTVLRYCDNGFLVVWDCAWSGQGCGWVDNRTGYDCGGNGAGPGGGDTPPDEPESPPPAPLPPGSCGTATETRVAELVNEARVRNGLSPLTCDPAAVQAAQAHSRDQCQMGWMSHTGSDGSDAGDRLRRAGGRFGGWGENVAYGTGSPEGVHDMWMNSPGHYANIMGNFSRFGVGHDPCGGSNYWTEAFMD
ncbi:CAP domain-containing protein [Myxococcota bacterium]|nr:CAP domain-containing protein [Myxococcota bacterium]